MKIADGSEYNAPKAELANGASFAGIIHLPIKSAGENDSLHSDPASCELTESLEGPGHNPTENRRPIVSSVTSALPAFERKLDAGEITMPASASRPTKVHFPTVAKIMGVSSPALHQWRSKHRAQWDAIERRHPPQLVAPSGVPPYNIATFAKDFLALKEARGAVASTREQQASALNNARWALKWVAEHTDCDQPAIDALREAVHLLDADETVKSRAQLRSLVRDMQRSLPALRAADGLPPDFGAALHLACQASGYSSRAIAKHAGINEFTFATWFEDVHAPSPNFHPNIQRVERFLGLPDGTLVQRMRQNRNWNGQVHSQRYPEELRGPKFEKLRARISRLLTPDDLAMADDDLHAVILDLAIHIDQERSPYEQARSRLMREPYALSNLPLGLAEEVAAFVRCASSADLDLDLLPMKATWGADQCLWFEDFVRAIGGFMVAPFDKGGLDMRIEDLSLAYMVTPTLLKKFVAFKQRRQKSVEQAATITAVDVRHMRIARMAIDPTFGFIGQQPDFVERLAPVEGLIKQADIEALRRDWTVTCAKHLADYDKLIAACNKKVTERGDLDHRIHAILKAPSPLAAFGMLNEEAHKTWQALAPGTRASHLALRDRVLIGVQTQFAARCKLAARLDLCHLVKIDDEYRLHVPRELFKNKRSSFFKQGDRYIDTYERFLVDVHGLYEAFDEYLARGRAAILDGRKTDALFVCEHQRNASKRARHEVTRESGRFSRESLSNRVRAMSERYLAWNPRLETGIRGVRPFGNHLLRDILATGVLKSTNDPHAAADAICDTIETIARYYVYWDPNERSRTIATVIAKAIKNVWVDSASVSMPKP